MPLRTSEKFGEVRLRLEAARPLETGIGSCTQTTKITLPHNKQESASISLFWRRGLGASSRWEVGGTRLETSSRFVGSKKRIRGLNSLVYRGVRFSSNSRFQTALSQQLSADISHATSCPRGPLLRPLCPLALPSQHIRISVVVIITIMITTMAIIIMIIIIIIILIIIITTTMTTINDY